MTASRFERYKTNRWHRTQCDAAIADMYAMDNALASRYWPGAFAYEKAAAPGSPQQQVRPALTDQR